MINKSIPNFIVYIYIKLYVYKNCADKKNRSCLICSYNKHCSSMYICTCISEDNNVEEREIRCLCLVLIFFRESFRIDYIIHRSTLATGLIMLHILLQDIIFQNFVEIQRQIIWNFKKIQKKHLWVLETKTYLKHMTRHYTGRKRGSLCTIYLQKM